MKKTIDVTTIQDDDDGYDNILSIANQIFQDPNHSFDFDFSKCAKLEHNGIVMIGGLARYVNYQNFSKIRSLKSLLSLDMTPSAGVMFKVDTMRSIISNQLIQNNFLKHFSHNNFGGYAEGEYIGYREHKNSLDSDNLAMHLKKQWLSSEKIKLSVLLKEAMVSRILEIFTNAYGHGTSEQEIDKLGVYSCGQYDKKERKLNLSVLDFGQGIINNVRKHKTEINNDLDAMHWALKRGNTTSTDSKGLDIPRGLGFDLLKKFSELNKGELRIYSNNVSAIAKNGNDFEVDYTNYHLKGTLVSIKINCDNQYYRFLSEPAVAAPTFF
jgi:hypothetical protein